MAARARWLVPSLLVAGLAACATFRGGDDPPEVTPRERLIEAAAALDRGDFRTAYADLSWVYTHCPASRVGRDALLLMATAELDPRNEARRPDVAASLAAEYLALPAAPVEVRPAATSIYLVARELGAEPPRVDASALPDSLVRLSDECDPRAPAGLPPTARARGLDDESLPTAERPLWLPELPVAPVPERIARLEAQRDSVSAQMAALLEQVKQLQARVASQQQEIERIRKTLRP